MSSSRVRSGPSARAMVESLRMAFRRRSTSSCYGADQFRLFNVPSLLKGYSYLELVNEHGNGVKLVTLLTLHDVFVSRAVVRSVKERMAVVQDLRGGSCSHSLREQEATSGGSCWQSVMCICVCDYDHAV